MLRSNEFKSSFAREARAARQDRLAAEAANRQAFDKFFEACVERVKAADDVIDSMGRPGSVKYGSVIATDADATMSIEFFAKRSDGFEIEFEYRRARDQVGKIRVFDRDRSLREFIVKMSDDELVVDGEGIFEFVESLLKELLIDSF